MEDSKNIKRRKLWVDYSKGIAILLVIIGHCLHPSIRYQNLLRGVIFSFHMPLFFVLSGATYSVSKTKEEYFRKLGKSFKNTFLIALFLLAVRILYQFIIDPLSVNWPEYLSEKAISFLFASGFRVRVGNNEIQALGMMWFLICMFFSKAIYDLICLIFKNRYCQISVMIVASVSGWLLSKIQWLPFSLDIALYIIPYYYCGKFLNTINDFSAKKKLSVLAITTILWGISLLTSYLLGGGYLELAQRRYSFMPLTFLCAVSGSYTICILSMIITEKNKGLCTEIFSYFGNYSIYLFAVHTIDYFYSSLWSFSNNIWITVFMRLLLDISLSIVVIYISRREILQISR